MIKSRRRTGYGSLGAFMSERTWEKYGASTGIAFGILLLAAIFIAPTPPHIDASSVKIANYYGDHRHAVLAAGVIGAFASIAAVLFICHLRHVFDRAEGGIEGLSTIVLASGVVAVGLASVGGMLGTTLAFMTAQPGGLHDAGLVRALYDVVWVSNGVTFMFVAAWLGAVAVGMVRGEVASPMLGWFAGLVAVACLVAAIGQLTVSSYSAGWTAVGFVAIVGLAAWDIVAGALMIRQPAVEGMSSHRPLIAPTH